MVLPYDDSDDVQRLRQELRLAEEGLANSVLEIEQLKKERDEYRRLAHLAREIINSRERALGFESIPDVPQTPTHDT